ncbi:hypothetical protein [Yoonia litorea]|uniref:hypothetical protein n=1 Tax=Yoonia litorea TaxID=1123755 RepID=UPI0013F4C104|nr:hypothetical protein [Yoonia litorea]
MARGDGISARSAFGAVLIVLGGLLLLVGLRFGAPPWVPFSALAFVGLGAVLIFRRTKG